MSRPLTVVYDIGDDVRRRALTGLLRRCGGLWVQGSTWVFAPGAVPTRRVVAAGARLVGQRRPTVGLRDVPGVRAAGQMVADGAQPVPGREPPGGPRREW